jgi:hypothetical protein
LPADAQITPLELCGGQMRHFVVRAAQLEAEYALHVFALQIHAMTHSLRERCRQFQRRLFGNVIDTRGEDFLQVVGAHDANIIIERAWLIRPAVCASRSSLLPFHA